MNYLMSKTGHILSSIINTQLNEHNIMSLNTKFTVMLTNNTHTHKKSHINKFITIVNHCISCYCVIIKFSSILGSSQL
jgi:hypothetical protein